MRLYLLIALAGSLGAIARFAVINYISHDLDLPFPLGTLAVNVLGSALMGFLGVYSLQKFYVPPEYRIAILTGFLGAFTTTSTFSIDSLSLMENNQWILASIYITSTVVLCIAAARGGMILAERI